MDSLKLIQREIKSPEKKYFALLTQNAYYNLDTLKVKNKGSFSRIEAKNTINQDKKQTQTDQGFENNFLKQSRSNDNQRQVITSQKSKKTSRNFKYQTLQIGQQQSNEIECQTMSDFQFSPRLPNNQTIQTQIPSTDQFKHLKLINKKLELQQESRVKQMINLNHCQTKVQKKQQLDQKQSQQTKSKFLDKMNKINEIKAEHWNYRYPPQSYRSPFKTPKGNKFVLEDFMKNKRTFNSIPFQAISKSIKNSFTKQKFQTPKHSYDPLFLYKSYQDLQTNFLIRKSLEPNRHSTDMCQLNIQTFNQCLQKKIFQEDNEKNYFD